MSDQAQARGAVVEMVHPECVNEAVQVLGNPLKFSRTPVRYQTPPPRMGQDSDRVLEVLRSAITRRDNR